MKNTAFWNVAPSYLVEVYLGLGGTCYINLHSRKVNGVRIKVVKI
jgi:hypothetical protein